MFRFIQYLKFLLKSTNQHGVHSPFVFDFLTKCLYLKNKNRIEIPNIKGFSRKNAQTMVSILAYFKVKKVYVHDAKNTDFNIIFETLNIQKTSISNHSKTIDAFIFNTSFNFEDFLKNTEQNLHNDSFLLLFKNSYPNWNSIKKHPKTVVTIDCWVFMLVFFRKEQRKQNFFIRL